MRSGIDLKSASISPNTIQLSDDIELTPVLERIQTLSNEPSSLTFTERSENCLNLMEARQEAYAIIAGVDLEIDYALAELNAEQNVYNEMLCNFNSTVTKILRELMRSPTF